MRADLAGAALAALVVAGCGGDGSTRAATKPKPSPSPSAAVSTRPLPTLPGPLEPGSYTTGIKPRLRLKLGRGWRLVNTDTILYGDDPQAGPYISIVQSPRVVDPERRFTSEKIPSDALLPTPRDLAGWFARHPRMEGRLHRRATLAGRRVPRVDVRVVRGYRFKGCPKACVVVFAFGPDNFGFLPVGTVLHAYVVDGPGGPVSIGAFGAGKRFAVDGAVAERVLREASFVDD